MAGGPDGAWELFGKIGGPGGNWLLTDLDALSDAPAALALDGLRIERVDSREGLATWLGISAAGFGHTEEELMPFYRAYARHGFGPEAYSLHYTGYRGEKTVTSGTLLLAGGIAGLFDISTPPALRRQGFAGAISRVMLQEARRFGYRQAYVWSSPMGLGVYQEAGFDRVDIGMREYQWRRRTG